MVQMIRVEVEAVEIGFPAAVDDLAPKRAGETGLVVNPVSVACEIRDYNQRPRVSVARIVGALSRDPILATAAAPDEVDVTAEVPPAFLGVQTA